MNKRKQMHDDSTGHGSSTAVTPTPSKKSKRLTRHMYTNEQQRFVWYHRDILKMSAKEAHKKFYNYFSTEVAVSVNGLNQLAGRLRRMQSPEVVSAKNTEIWALPASEQTLPDQPFQIITPNDLLDGRFRSSGSGESGQEESGQEKPGGDGSEKDSSKPVESGRGESGQEESGQDERRIIADGHQLSPSRSPGPTDPSSPPRRRHPRRHMYTIEEHRFVWFHRFYLMMKASQTHEMFQKTFHIPSVKKDHLNQLAARLWRHSDPKVTTITHVEPWAVRVVFPGTAALKDTEGKASGVDIGQGGCVS